MSQNVPPGWNQPPPGPPPPPAPYPYASRFSVGNAFNWGWDKTLANAGSLVLGLLVYAIVGLLLYGIIYVASFGMLSLGMQSAVTTDANGYATYGSSPVGALFSVAYFGVIGLLAIALTLYQFVVQAALIRAGLILSRGGRVDFGTMFTFRRLGTILLAALLVGLMTAVGYALCVLPGLAVIFYSQYVLFFVIDRDLGVMDAIKASWTFVNRNLGDLLLLFLACMAAYFVGSLVCGVGLLIAVPVAILAQTYAYRSLQGEPVAA